MDNSTLVFPVSAKVNKPWIKHSLKNPHNIDMAETDILIRLDGTYIHLALDSGDLVLPAGSSLVVQWLRIRAPNAGIPGLIPGQGTRSHMLQLRPREAKFLAALGLQCCVWAYSCCCKQGLLCVAVSRLFIVEASLVAEHKPSEHGLSSCGTRA